ncbi:hypothetical protein ETB97_001179 [Aspergillus alliaceus]|uniref:Uncharacterized protein n=1 Tax=Petromyces alliaceus TaxID=209559 RepID=A0A8H6A150_PETAA|nr:hypothetical protein ETB97_001179 [Aspergillus burnettii]
MLYCLGPGGLTTEYGNHNSQLSVSSRSNAPTNMMNRTWNQPYASSDEARGLRQNFLGPQGDYFTFDAIAEIIFGMRYNALREPTYRFVAHALEASNVRISALAQAPMLTTGRLDKNLFPSSIRGRNQFLGFISSLLRCCSKASFSDNGNMFTFLETTKDPVKEKMLSKSEI